MKVAFDIDGTLIHSEGPKLDTPNYLVIELFNLLDAFGCELYIWSGGGIDYAEMWRNKLGLDAKVVEKGSFIPDIAIDDQEVNLGRINLKI